MQFLFIENRAVQRVPPLTALKSSHVTQNAFRAQNSTEGGGRSDKRVFVATFPSAARKCKRVRSPPPHTERRVHSLTPLLKIIFASATLYCLCERKISWLVR